jgi:protein disulfide-isomerase A1
MKELVVFAVLALAALIAATDSVVVLNHDNFKEAVNKTEYTLVEFYAPWCPHCKSLASEYEQLATDFKVQTNLQIAKIDCDQEENKDLAEKYEIQGFPTIKLFKNGAAFRDYDGERNAESMKKWIVKKTGPLAVPANDANEIDDLVKKSHKEGSSVLLGFFTSKDSDDYKSFIKSAGSKDLEDFIIGEAIGLSEDITSKYIDGKDGVVLLRHFEQEHLKTNDIASLVNFTIANGYPLIDELSGKTFRRFVDANLPIAILFLDPESDSKALLETLKPVAEKFRGKVVFGHSDGKAYGEQLSVMGGDPAILPGLALMKLDKRQNFPYSGKVENAEDVQVWMDGILEGKVDPYSRSEPVPEKNDDAVKIVVGKTFEEIVYDKDKDVLLEYYAPWCGHCKTLEPKFKKLAQKLSHVKNLVIAKIDGTENDTPVSIEGFPTIYFFPANNKTDPVVYEGNRTPKDILKFIRKHAVACKGDLKPNTHEQEKPKSHDEL